MRIAVSGGTGFIGQPLVERLADAGHEVVVLTRRPEAQIARLPPRARAIAFDAEQGAGTGLLDTCDALIHLAGAPMTRRLTDAYKTRILNSRVRGTRTLAQAAVASGTVRTVISASAIGFYGDRGAEPLSESSPPGDDFFARVCTAWEAALEPAERGGIRTVTLRFGQVLHPDGGRLGSQLSLYRLGLGGRLGRGEQYVSWIHREDLHRLIEHALHHSTLAGPINATAPEPVQERVFAQTLAHALHRPAWLPVPATALKLALGELSGMLLGGQRVLPKRAVESGFSFQHPELAGALEDLLRTTSATATAAA